MVALNLLAASLLVAGVGSSLGLPSPMNVAVLPAIGTIYCFDDANDHLSNVFVSPVLEEFTLITSGDHAISVSLDFGDISVASDDILAVGEFFYFTYDVSLPNSVDVVTYDDFGELADIPTVYVALSDSCYFCSYSLPSLQYWAGMGDGSYVLAFLPYAVPSLDGYETYAYYGLFGYDANDDAALRAVDYAALGSDVNPIDAIADGLTAIVPLGGAFVDGFDAVFMDGTALTAIGSFAFILMGIGISVGITKKCFNWVTGRHGM